MADAASKKDLDLADAKNKFDYTKLNTLAVVSLASAISLFGAPAAVLSGHISLAQLKESKEKGRWMAITGLVLGYVGIALAVIFTIVNLVLKARHGMGFDDDHMFQREMFDRRHDFNDDFRPIPLPTDPMSGTN
ncbi:MAG: DUF4190 domain-containing protein [Rhodoluna sp.]